MKRLTALAVLLLAAGCSTETPNTPTPTTDATVTTSETPSGPPPLEDTAQQWVNDNNDTIGENNTHLIHKYATPDCATQVLAMFGDTTNEASETTLINVTQDGTRGTVTTSEAANPGSQGITNWVYQDRWRFTCDGLFEVSVN